MVGAVSWMCRRPTADQPYEREFHASNHGTGKINREKQKLQKYALSVVARERIS